MSSSKSSSSSSLIISSSSLKNRLQQQQRSPSKRRQRRYYVFYGIVFILVCLAVINYIELSPSSTTSIDRFLRQLSKSTTTKQQQQQQQQVSSQQRRQKPSIAICITGMPERLQPWHVIKNLIGPNQNSFDHLTIVYALSTHSQLKYSSRPDAIFEPSPFSQYKTPIDLKQALIEEGHKYGIDLSSSTTTSSSQKIHLDVLDFIPDLSSKEEWLERFNNNNGGNGGNGNNVTTTTNITKLDRITQYDDTVGTQLNILNMYNHQVICGKHLLDSKQKFDYVINTREDAHYFKLINLNRLVAVMKTTSTPTSINNQEEDNNNDSSSSSQSSYCDLITKDCLDFGGINMRFQFIESHMGIKLLTERLEFYKRMYGGDDDDNNKDDNKSSSISNSIPSYIPNPEQFELQQLLDSNGKVCKLSINQIPVNVGRHTQNREICFLPFEVMMQDDQQCVPLEFIKYVNKRKCYNF